MNLTALILAGGIGKRFLPLTSDKNLWPFAGQPILSYTISDLHQAGVTNIVIVTNPQNDSLIHRLFPHIKTIIQPQPLGMANAILTAAPVLKQPILIVNADDLFDSSAYSQIINHIATHQPKFLLTAWETDQLLPAGYFQIKDNTPVGIIEKPTLDQKPSNLVKLVADYFREPKPLFDQLQSINSTSRDAAYEHALTKILSTQSASFYHYQGHFHPLKYPWHTLSMMDEIFATRFKPHQADSASIHPTAVIIGPVFLSDGVKVLPHATIKGPTYIGPNTIIGNNALVRESNLNSHVVVGYNTEIARSWIGDHCWFHSNYIGDSVLETDVSFGAGTITANFRLDHQPIKDTGRIKLGAMIGHGTRVGVNTSLMPGIKLGSQTVVGPGLVLNQDLTDNQTHFK